MAAAILMNAANWWGYRMSSVLPTVMTDIWNCSKVAPMKKETSSGLARNKE